MKTSTLNNAKLLSVLLLLAGFAANAQSLPAKQKTGLRAPAGIKVDGKTTEWDNKFQAYNHATDIFYTLANDNDKLYLAVQATDPLIIRKITNGGITLKINTAGEKDGGIAITYPVFPKNDRPVINLKDKPSDSRQLDSVIAVINKQFADKSKEIKIHGIASIPDSLISIYNQDDIKVATLVDHSAAFNYELSIPLKYIGLSAVKASKFNYTITLNGSPLIDGVKIIRSANSNIAVIQVSVGAGAPAIPNSGERDILRNSTYFGGEYILVAQ